MLDVGIDVDGCLYLFGPVFLQYCVDRGLIDEGAVVEVEDFDFFLEYGFDFDKFRQICHEGVDDGVIFYSGEPIEGVKEALSRLWEARCRIHIVTDRNYGADQGSEKLTRRWFEDHGLPYDTMTFTGDKTSVKTDVFVDDKIENFDDLDAAGTLVYLYDRPWNQVEGGDTRRRVSSLDEFVDKVLDDNEVRMVSK